MSSEMSTTSIVRHRMQYRGTRHDFLCDSIYLVINQKSIYCCVFDFFFLFNTDHRHTFHHTHHPLSTHLPLPQRLRKRVHSTDRKRKKKRKKKKTSLPPSEVTPTIHEVDEEEAESEREAHEVAATPTELPDIQPQVK